MNQKSSNGVTRKRRVFIVDDHPLVRDGLANFINQQADLAVCGEAEDSAGAIAGIGRYREPRPVYRGPLFETASGERRVPPRRR